MNFFAKTSSGPSDIRTFRLFVYLLTVFMDQFNTPEILITLYAFLLSPILMKYMPSFK